MKSKKVLGFVLVICFSILIGGILWFRNEGIRGHVVRDEHGYCYLVDEKNSLGMLTFEENALILSSGRRLQEEELQTGDVITIYWWRELLECYPYRLEGIRLAFVERGEAEGEYESIYESIMDHLNHD